MPAALTKNALTRYGLEAALIVFSVLLALYLDQTFENRREARLVNELIEHVAEEMRSNLEIIDKWLPYHQDVVAEIERHLASDELRATLVSEDGIDYFRFMEDGLIQDFYSTAAWQIALRSEIASSVEFEITHAMSEAYHSQVLVDRTLTRLGDFFFDRNVHDPAQLDASLTVMLNLMQELAGQENVLRLNYQAALQLLEMR